MDTTDQRQPSLHHPINDASLISLNGRLVNVDSVVEIKADINDGPQAGSTFNAPHTASSASSDDLQIDETTTKANTNMKSHENIKDNIDKQVEPITPTTILEGDFVVIECLADQCMDENEHNEENNNNLETDFQQQFQATTKSKMSNEKSHRYHSKHHHHHHHHHHNPRHHSHSNSRHHNIHHQHSSHQSDLHMTTDQNENCKNVSAPFGKASSQKCLETTNNNDDCEHNGDQTGSDKNKESKSTSLCSMNSLAKQQTFGPTSKVHRMCKRHYILQQKQKDLQQTGNNIEDEQQVSSSKENELSNSNYIKSNHDHHCHHGQRHHHHHYKQHSNHHHHHYHRHSTASTKQPQTLSTIAANTISNSSPQLPVSEGEGLASDSQMQDKQQGLIHDGPIESRIDEYCKTPLSVSSSIENRDPKQRQHKQSQHLPTANCDEIERHLRELQVGNQQNCPSLRQMQVVSSSSSATVASSNTVVAQTVTDTKSQSMALVPCTKDISNFLTESVSEESSKNATIIKDIASIEPTKKDNEFEIEENINEHMSRLIQPAAQVTSCSNEENQSHIINNGNLDVAESQQVKCKHNNLSCHKNYHHHYVSHRHHSRHHHQNCHHHHHNHNHNHQYQHQHQHHNQRKTSYHSGDDKARDISFDKHNQPSPEASNELQDNEYQKGASAEAAKSTSLATNTLANSRSHHQHHLKNSGGGHNHHYHSNSSPHHNHNHHHHHHHHHHVSSRHHHQIHQSSKDSNHHHVSSKHHHAGHQSSKGANHHQSRSKYRHSLNATATLTGVVCNDAETNQSTPSVEGSSDVKDDKVPQEANDKTNDNTCQVLEPTTCSDAKTNLQKEKQKSSLEAQPEQNTSSIFICEQEKKVADIKENIEQNIKAPAMSEAKLISNQVTTANQDQDMDSLSTTGTQLEQTNHQDNNPPSSEPMAIESSPTIYEVASRQSQAGSGTSLRRSSSSVSLNRKPRKRCWCLCCPWCHRSPPKQKKKKKPIPAPAVLKMGFKESRKPPVFSKPPPNQPLDEIRSWNDSFDRLMRNDEGRGYFQEFLRCEYSEENMLFWLACEQLKRETDQRIINESARDIYEAYISILSSSEVSLDSKVRDSINSMIERPHPHIFDEAQMQIYTLMHRDSYPRFIGSPVYKKIAHYPFDPSSDDEPSPASN